MAEKKGEPATSNEKVEKRVEWDKSIEFLMSCIALSIGLGNVWRFPFTAYENGGGAFLIPYLIVLIVIGRPMYYLEMALGQFSSRGNVKMFGLLCPALKGIGYAQVIATSGVATYYCSLMATTLFYLVNSFTSELPWSICRPEWELENMTCIASTEKGNFSNGVNVISSSELYYTKEVLKEKYDLTNGLGVPDWRLTICLFVSWLITFLVSCRGVRSSGKAAYFLAIFPYVIMITLFVRAITLDGASNGMLYFINPDWKLLLTADVWYAAVTQCFFSLSVGTGPITIYASYNKFHHNINRDALVVTTLDTFTSVLAGSTIFGIMGNLAHELNVDMKDVINSGGSGLAFISYPEAIAKFQVVPWLFAILFFSMLFILGIGSLVALQYCSIKLIKDKYPKLKYWQIALITSSIGFMIGLVYVTPGGQFILNLVDHFAGTFLIFIIAILEVICACWIYGLENICRDVHYMVKHKVGLYWRITWGVITPITLIVIFVYFLISMPRLKYGQHEYPNSILDWGWVILAVTMCQLILWMFYYIYKNWNQGFPKMLTEPFTSDKWAPLNPKDYEGWRKYKEEKHEEISKRFPSRRRQILYAVFGR